MHAHECSTPPLDTMITLPSCFLPCTRQIVRFPLQSHSEQGRCHGRGNAAHLLVLHQSPPGHIIFGLTSKIDKAPRATERSTAPGLAFQVGLVAHQLHVAAVRDQVLRGPHGTGRYVVQRTTQPRQKCLLVRLQLPHHLRPQERRPEMAQPRASRSGLHGRHSMAPRPRNQLGTRTGAGGTWHA
jgi:hypothetical protein